MNQAPLARLVEVQLRVLPCGAALSRGMPCEAYCHAASVPAVLASLVCRIDRQGRRVNTHTRTHTHTHTPLTHAHRALHFIAVRLLSSRRGVARGG